MKKPVYLDFSILDLSKTVMYEFWYDHVNPKYWENSNFFIWIQTDSLFMQKQMIYVKMLQKMLEQDFVMF